MKYLALSMVLSVSLMAASLDLGNSVFYNYEGKINIAADAGVVVRNMDSPYVMFYLYVSVNEGLSADVYRDDVVMVFRDKEYMMPAIAELRKNYNGDSRDMVMYVRLGKEPMIFSDVKFYRYNFNDDFFPGKKSWIIPAEHGYIY